jgi:imidazolonepropionase-like amidohydrolase
MAHATVNGAKQLGDDKLGRIRKGAYGDCLVLVGNPLEDCRVLDSGKEGIWAVIKEGRVVVARGEIAHQMEVDVVLGVGE